MSEMSGHGCSASHIHMFFEHRFLTCDICHSKPPDTVSVDCGQGSPAKSSASLGEEERESAEPRNAVDLFPVLIGRHVPGRLEDLSL